MNNKTKALVAAGHALAKELHCAESAALVREMATQLDVQHVRADLLAAENAYLLPKAASELSNAWILHKYWVGINAALMHIWAGRLPDAVAWLENTVAGPGIDVPRLTDSAGIEKWAADQQKDSISHAKALEIIKENAPATNVTLAAERAEGVDQYAKHQRERADGLKSRNSRLAEEARGMAADAEDFAAWLREAQHG